MGEVVVTYLELTDPDRIRPAGAPPPGVELGRVEPPDGAVNRWFYETIGAAWSWTDLRGRDAAWWRARAERVETWVLRVDGEPAGYFELERRGDDVQIAFLGLLTPFHGRGLGGHLVERALRRGLELGGRVWLHTCTLDGPHALANYEARGLESYRVER
jgi:GNAT superfamily N-acetyltransferase